MSRPAKPVPMCCVTIGYEDFLLPAAEGMRLVQLLQFAVTCHRDFTDRDYRYTAGEAPRVQYTAVQPDQIKCPAGAITPDHAPLRLKGSK